MRSQAVNVQGPRFQAMWGPQRNCIKRKKSSSALYFPPIMALGSHVAIDGNTMSKTVAKHKIKKKGRAEWAIVIMLLPVMF